MRNSFGHWNDEGTTIAGTGVERGQIGKLSVNNSVDPERDLDGDSPYMPRWVRGRAIPENTLSATVECFEEDLESFAQDEGFFIEGYRLPKSLEPTVMSPPALAAASWSGFGILGFFALGVIAAAMLASSFIGILGQSEALDEEPISFGMRCSGQPADREEANSFSERPSQQTPRLSITETTVRTADPAVPLHASLSGPIEGCTIRIEGLAKGSTLNVGEAWGATGWRLAPTELDAALVRPPWGFVGGMDLTLQLRRPDDSVVDRKRVHVEWSRPASPCAQFEQFLNENRVQSFASDHSEDREVLFRQFLEWQKRQSVGP